MAEKTSPASEKDTGNPLRRLWTLTIISLALNGLILLLLVVGFIFHHHRHHHHHGFGGGPWGERGSCMGGGRESGHEFHHFGGGFEGGPDMIHHDGGPGMMGGAPGMMHHGFGGGMMGGSPPDPTKMTDMMLDHLSAKLTLTDDEKAKIKPILAAQADQMQKDMEAMRQAHEKAMQDTKDKIKALLTPDQQKLLDAIPQPGQKPDDLPKPAGP